MLNGAYVMIPEILFVPFDTVALIVVAFPIRCLQSTQLSEMSTLHRTSVN